MSSYGIDIEEPRVKKRKMVSKAPDTITELMETIFSENYLYKRPNIKKLVEDDPKGFVSIRELMAEPICA